MNLAIAMLNGRVAPLFDASRIVLVVELGVDGPAGSCQRTLDPGGSSSRVASLVRWDVNLLICGAITRELAGELESRGIEVCALVAGEVERVLAAYLDGTLHHEAFGMPGRVRSSGTPARPRDPEGFDPTRT